ncbi:hypothetical protein BDY19DRAFT_928323 [Irpex rosettiformis]|uniref:Uncharacterized protein n=1 Tax=Irpex rosettiformis TaxID=378272 RepID=A0ACB8UCR8_9APHY|nr:hypothetical protein BDY19DRAFT_928323 [Irpex rosettiformis]
MALNWAMLDASRSPVPLPHELIVRTVSAADVSVTVPNAPPTSTSTSGGSGGTRKLTGSGKIWLTDNRLIFVTHDAPPKGAESTAFDSLSVPLAAILSTKFEQPFLGQNYLVVEIKPAAEGGLTNGTKAEIRLKDKGLFEFVSVLEKTRERAIYMKRSGADEEEGLPGYSTPSNSAGSSTATIIPDEAPPGYDAPSYQP